MLQRTCSLATLVFAVGCQTASSTVQPYAELSPSGDRVDQLGAILAASGGGQLTEAVLPTFGPPVLSEGSEVESLQTAMNGLELEHAARCQNIANAHVPGYKRHQVVEASWRDKATGVAMPLVTDTRQDMAQGPLERTDRWLDLAIDGSGFFQVRRPDGSLSYTRSGSFRQAPGGKLVTSEGYLLTDQVTVPEGFGPDSLLVSTDGLVFPAPVSSNVNLIGSIRVHVFADAAALTAVGQSHFLPSAQSGAPESCQPDMNGAGRLRQGYLERSNVEVTQELADLRLIERRAAAVRLALASHGVYSL
jgi:flagellar basal-body rod protein FlgG